MSTAGWIGWIVAIIALGVVGFLIWRLVARPVATDQKLLKAIQDAQEAKEKASERERQLQTLIQGAKSELERVAKIPDTKERLAALARFANRTIPR